MNAREQFAAYYRWARTGCVKPELLPVRRDERIKACAHQVMLDRTWMRMDETYNIHARNNSKRLDIYDRLAGLD